MISERIKAWLQNRDFQEGKELFLEVGPTNLKARIAKAPPYDKTAKGLIAYHLQKALEELPEEAPKQERRKRKPKLHELNKKISGLARSRGMLADTLRISDKTEDIEHNCHVLDRLKELRQEQAKLELEREAIKQGVQPVIETSRLPSIKYGESHYSETKLANMSANELQKLIGQLKKKRLKYLNRASEAKSNGKSQTEISNLEGAAETTKDLLLLHELYYQKDQQERCNRE